MRAAAQGILDTVLPASQGFNPDYQPGQSSSGKLFDANVLQNIKKKKKKKSVSCRKHNRLIPLTMATISAILIKLKLSYFFLPCSLSQKIEPINP